MCGCGQGLEAHRQAHARSGPWRSCELPSRDRRDGRRLVDRHGDPHRGERTVEPGLGGPERDPEGGRGLGQRHPRGSSAATTSARHSGSRRLSARSRRSRSATSEATSPPIGPSIGVISTSIGRRRRRRRMSRQALHGRVGGARHRTGPDRAARAGPARLGPIRPGPRRARAPGPGGSVGLPRPAARWPRRRARRRRHDRPALPARRALAGPRSPSVTARPRWSCSDGMAPRSAESFPRTSPRRRPAGGPERSRPIRALTPGSR